ncbi:hypothetical protein [Oceanobacillus sp. J11TS1]|uniref:hypothetical protein n=1 Tax=Oceanobacillus sp. J11TS1 TaxID=2807191 RepID=UPI001B13861D|nr:hypothetical protein [Oceanobacillus sp. J11TS1]GIO25154.1 hypothetical protein J11TS1_37350 [Oceanobacillus sp. J11TS1]
MTKLESLNGVTVLHEDGTLKMTNKVFNAISNESLGTNMEIVTGTMCTDDVEGLRFRIVDNPVQWSESLGWLFSYKGAEISIEVSIAEKDKDKLEEIQGKIIEALKNAE